MSRALKPAKAKQAASEAAVSAPATVEIDPALFRDRLKLWYRRHARTLPWRGVNDPYATWLSEIMLQQTRVATVIDRYQEFLQRFPTIEALAAAEENDVLALWSGLGYYRRARMLHRGAQFVVRELASKLPRTALSLRTLPGVGDYTSAAIASIAFGESIAVVDGNVERVLLRVLGLPEDRAAPARARIAMVAQSLVPASARRRALGNPPGDHNQAMMELGATICLPKAPLCLQCPVVELCRTRGEHPTAARAPQRSRTVAHVVGLRKRGASTEVLLERRPLEASLMAGMLELPALPLDSVAGREPVLRVRHAITNTNYYVQIYTVAAPDAHPGLEHDHYLETLDGRAAVPAPASNDDDEAAANEDEQVFVAESAGRGPAHSLLNSVPAADSDLLWTSTERLPEVPLTGLARKVLKRLGIMSIPPVQID